MGDILYLVQNISVNGRSAVRWTIANATTFNILQQGTISDPTLSFFYPSIAANAAGDVVVGFSGSSSTTYASTYAVVGSSTGGAAGGTLTFGTPVQTKAGSNYYDGNRWGDYTYDTRSGRSRHLLDSPGVRSRAALLRHQLELGDGGNGNHPDEGR